MYNLLKEAWNRFYIGKLWTRHHSISTFITLFAAFSVKDLATFFKTFSHWLTTFVVTKQGRCPKSSQLRKTSSFEYGEGEVDLYFLFNHDHLLTLPSRWTADLEFLSNSASYFNFCFLSPLFFIKYNFDLVVHQRHYAKCMPTEWEDAVQKKEH